MDAAEAQQTETPPAEPPQPRPVVPIILSSEKPGDKVKEITARLEPVSYTHLGTSKSDQEIG